jgi:hypothetical protein
MVGLEEGRAENLIFNSLVFEPVEGESLIWDAQQAL